MEPFVVLALGAIVLAGGLLLLLSFGDAFRTARLLQTSRRVSIEQAIERASATAPATEGRLARIHGRVDSDDAFLDDRRRPLVYRRTRLQVARAGAFAGLPGRPRWRTVDERVEAVPFEVRDGLLSIAIRHDDIGSGLVVIPRQSTGTAAEIPDRLPPGIPPAARVRLVVEQLSAVEHVTALGVPRLGDDGVPVLTAAPGRSLVLTPLEDAEAMRILASESPRRPAAIAGLLVSGLGLMAVATAWFALRALSLA